MNREAGKLKRIEFTTEHSRFNVVGLRHVKPGASVPQGLIKQF